MDERTEKQRNFIPEIKYQENILSIFNTIPEVRGVYTDNNTAQNNITNTIYYPCFTYNVCKKIAINTPIFVKGAIKERFCNLKYLLYADFINRVCDDNLLWHLPQILFNINIIDKQALLNELKTL